MGEMHRRFDEVSRKIDKLQKSRELVDAFTPEWWDITNRINAELDRMTCINRCCCTHINYTTGLPADLRINL